MLACSTYPAEAVKFSSIRPAAEEILYGMEEVSSRTIQKAVSMIDEPETNPQLKRVQPRNDKEAEEEIKLYKKSIQGKINSINTPDLSYLKDRLGRLLSLDFSYLNSISLSYLLEQIDGEIGGSG